MNYYIGLAQSIHKKHETNVLFDEPFKRIHVLDRLESVLNLPLGDLLKAEGKIS